MEKIPKSWSADYKQSMLDALIRDIGYRLQSEDEEETDTIHHISEYFEEALEITKNPKQIRGLATGYTYLDELMCGMDKGELIVLGGRTAAGKTRMALNMIMKAYNSSKNPSFNTVIFSLEMPNVQITSRMQQLFSSYFADWQEIMSTLPIYLYSTRKAPSVKSMRKVLQKFKQENTLDLVMIDHLHYFSRDINSVTNEIGVLVREIKRMAVDFEVPVLLLAQPRKAPLGGGEKELEIDDLKDSAAIGQDADMILFVNAKKEDKDTVTVSLVKNRVKGRTGGCAFYIEKQTHQLIEKEYHGQ